MKIVLFSSIFPFRTFAGPWNKANNPHNFKIILKPTETLELKLDKLPLEAQLQNNRLGWSDYFWPLNKGGIAFRWNELHAQPFKNDLKSKEQLLKMTVDELSELSPAELYDFVEIIIIL